jgi:hypothetical protein
MRISKAFFTLAILCLTGMTPSLHAQAASVPYTFTSGTTASAAQVNADFAALAKYLPAVGYSKINYNGTLTTPAWVSIGSKTVTFPANGYAVISFSGTIIPTTYYTNMRMNIAASTSQTTSSDYQIINSYMTGSMSGYPFIGFLHKIIIPVTAGSSTFYALVNCTLPVQTGNSYTLTSTITGILEIDYFPNSL